MIDDTLRRSFKTPDVDNVAAVTIHHADAEDADKLFYANQYYHRDTFEDGTRWLCERETYILTEEYQQAVVDKTHIPVEDIRLEPLPTPTYDYSTV